MERFEIELKFHIDETGGLERIIYIVKAEDFASAFKAALTIKDHDFPNNKLKDVNVCELVQL